MHQPNLIGEARNEAPHRLRGERDFGHQHNGLFTLLQSIIDRTQVNFSFARASDTVKQKWAHPLSRNGLLKREPDFAPNIGLLAGEFGGRGGNEFEFTQRVAHGFAFPEEKQP